MLSTEQMSQLGLAKGSWGGEGRGQIVGERRKKEIECRILNHLARKAD